VLVSLVTGALETLKSRHVIVFGLNLDLAGSAVPLPYFMGVLAETVMLRVVAILLLLGSQVIAELETWPGVSLQEERSETGERLLAVSSPRNDGTGSLLFHFAVESHETTPYNALKHAVPGRRSRVRRTSKHED